MGNGIAVERNYGVDLLRIISMYMIVVLHVISADKILEHFVLCSFEYEVVWLLELIALPATNCYALISGFISIDGKHRYSNIVVLWSQVFFYCLIINVIYAFLGNSVEWKAVFFPTITNQYWYFTAYVGLFLCMPTLNIVIKHISQKKYLQLLVAGFIFTSLLPTIFDTDILGTANGYSMLWLSYLYLMGAYIKKYEMLKKFNAKCFFVIFFGTTIFTLGIKFVVEYVSWNYIEKLYLCDPIVRYTSPLLLLQAVSLLLAFTRMELSISLQKIIKRIAPFTFGVYLAHNNNVIRNTIFPYIHKYLYESSMIIFVASVILVSATIFIICVVIEFVRASIFKAFKLKERFLIIDKYLI